MHVVYVPEIHYIVNNLENVFIPILKQALEETVNVYKYKYL